MIELDVEKSLKEIAELNSTDGSDAYLYLVFKKDTKLEALYELLKKANIYQFNVSFNEKDEREVTCAFDDINLDEIYYDPEMSDEEFDEMQKESSKSLLDSLKDLAYCDEIERMSASFQVSKFVEVKKN